VFVHAPSRLSAISTNALEAASTDFALKPAPRLTPCKSAVRYGRPTCS
jgi:hypothetical protein